MSSRKFEKELDSSLRRSFANWASHQSPPARMRSVLLRRVKLELAAQHNPPGFVYESPGYSFMLGAGLPNNAGLFFSLQSRVRL